jgi:uncharacterized protein
MKGQVMGVQRDAPTSIPRNGPPMTSERSRVDSDAGDCSRLAVKTEYSGLQLRIFVHESLRRDHHALYEDLVLRACQAGLCGATVFRGMEGYGRHRHVHSIRHLDTADDLPMIVEIVDRPERVRDFVESLGSVAAQGLVTLSPVHVVLYAPESPA